jgi:L,D-transpeptidase ErfK/SrfK
LKVDPVSDIPASIQGELRLGGKPVVARVPPGPANPLRKYWLGLSVAKYGIHGTNAPASISRFQTHGCVRMHAADIEVLFASPLAHGARPPRRARCRPRAVAASSFAA